MLYFCPSIAIIVQYADPVILIVGNLYLMRTPNNQWYSAVLNKFVFTSAIFMIF